MTERRDDTTKPEAESRRAPGAGRYYYDDATGYEPYSPDEEEEGAARAPGGDGDDDEPSAGT